MGKMKTIFIALFGLMAGIVLVRIASNIKNSVKTGSSAGDLSSTPLRSWGLNAYGQLGKEGGNENHPTAFTVNTRPLDFVLGRSHSVLVDGDGYVWTWGENNYGQLGRETDFTFHAVPTRIPELNEVKAVAAANYHTIALKKDGTVWAWGSNYSGQLGDGTNAGRAAPKKIEGLEDVVQIATGYKFGLALKKDGSVWGWGTSCDTAAKTDALDWWKILQENISSIEGGYYDPAGDSYEVFDQREDCINEEIIGIQVKSPKKIEGLGDVKMMAGGYGHALILKKDGTVWSFGCNKYGQLGNGGIRNVETNSVPRIVEGVADIVQVSAGFRHSLALNKDGTVMAWGHNEFGEIGGKREVKESPVPVKVEGIGDVQDLVAGYDYSLAIKKDGSLWGWGKNGYGLLDKDAVLINSIPIQIKDIGEVEKVRAGGAHIIAQVGGK